MSSTQPWYRTVRRWGQTNLNELDPTNYDGEWWRGYWRRTRTQGVNNAGGSSPTTPARAAAALSRRTPGDRDLYGEINAAARGGPAVLARMDSNRATEAFYREHPTGSLWMPRAGRASRRAISVNTPFYKEFIPAVLREVSSATGPMAYRQLVDRRGRNHIAIVPGAGVFAPKSAVICFAWTGRTPLQRGCAGAMPAG